LLTSLSLLLKTNRLEYSYNTVFQLVVLAGAFINIKTSIKIDQRASKVAKSK